MERGQVMELMRPNGRPRAGDRAYDQLDQTLRAFVGRQRLMLVSAGPELTSRTGPPGFVRVVGPRGLEWTEPFGVSGAVSLLFVDFFRDKLALRTDGRAMIVDGRARMRVERAFVRRM